MSQQTPRRVDVPQAGTRVEVDHTLWTAPGSVPPTHAELGWDAEALHCRLVSAEDSPLTRHHQPNSPVHLDSCLEWFLAPWPGEGLYLNLEANSAGTLFAAFGSTTHRELLSDHLRTLVHVRAEVSPHQWSVTFQVPHTLLDALADLAGRARPELAVGTIFGANFYKCGDETEVEHYGAWNPITGDEPRFHRPDQFGQLVLVP